MQRLLRAMPKIPAKQAMPTYDQKKLRGNHYPNFQASKFGWFGAAIVGGSMLATFATSTAMCDDEENELESNQNASEPSHYSKTKGDWDVREEHFPEIWYIKNKNSHSSIDEIHMELLPSQLNFSLEEPYTCLHSVIFNIQFNTLTEQQRQLIKSFDDIDSLVTFKDHNSLYMDFDFTRFNKSGARFEQFMSILQVIGSMDDALINEITEKTLNPESSQFSAIMSAEMTHLVNIMEDSIAKLPDEAPEQETPRPGKS